MMLSAACLGPIPLTGLGFLMISSSGASRVHLGCIDAPEKLSLTELQILAFSRAFFFATAMSEFLIGRRQGVPIQ
jgi:hypothetical protein